MLSTTAESSVAKAMVASEQERSRYASIVVIKRIYTPKLWLADLKMKEDWSLIWHRIRMNWSELVRRHERLQWQALSTTLMQHETGQSMNTLAEAKGDPTPLEIVCELQYVWHCLVDASIT